MFSKKYGKISVGTGLNEGRRGKAALAMRPFTMGKYELYKGRDYYNLSGAETTKSYYSIGGDIDKYMAASYALEVTDKMTEESQPVPKVFNLLTDVLNLIEKRRSRYETPLLAYQIKVFKELGYLPAINRCVMCGEDRTPMFFGVKEGGIICEKCGKEEDFYKKDPLIFQTDFGIVSILNYFLENPLERLEKIALDKESAAKMQHIVRAFGAYHLNIGDLKSEYCLKSE